ncbi:hypothetical protein MF672_027905 [Actinomadura sp. ATCC 31491]|uniref:PH domain-containing protein n=1 Tax=Actinomadura luzonensis TaxID=2805427 RepID=A0ABT0FZ91_9ACTN|nr:hypothetical protein [Actinomadura luzonensis]MCK2217589.1 hypothetical protein [Actinomadura luzonensis]
MDAIGLRASLPLHPEEKVLWAGAPSKHRPPPVGAGLLIPLGMAVLGVVGMGPVLMAGFDPFLTVFFIVWEGIALSSGPIPWLRTWLRGRSLRYTVTDRRILLTWGDRDPQWTSYEYGQLGPPMAVRRGVRMEWLRQPGKSVELHDIPDDPVIVRELITRARAKLLG